MFSSQRKKTLKNSEVAFEKNNHVGTNIKAILKQKGLKGQAFAKGMNYSRQTLYKRLESKEWDESEILLASQLLQVSVARIKGRAFGQKGLEHEIYEELRKMNTFLEQIWNRINTTN